MTKFALNIIKKIKHTFINIKDLKKCILCFVLTFLSACTLLFSGTKSPSFNTYSSASYYADIVKRDNRINNIGLVVKQKSKDSIMPDTATELRSLYGAFGNRISNYAGTINAEKKHSINFEEYEITENLSFVYVQTGVNVNKSKVNPTHYRMEFYPLDLMFKYYANSPTKFFSFMYISTIHARKIIDSKFPGMFESSIPTSELANNHEFIDKCEEEILGKGLQMDFDGTVKNFQVTNIFYAEDYFYNTIFRTLGDFVVGYNQYPDGFTKEATYFLNEYEYQNNFYLEYLERRYNDGNYDFGLVSKNYKSEWNYSKGFSFLEKQNYSLFVILIIISVILIIASFILMFKFHLFNLTYSIYSLLSLLVPHFFGLAFYLITKNIGFFSPFYSNASLICVILFSILYLFCFIIGKYKNREIYHE